MSTFSVINPASGWYKYLILICVLVLLILAPALVVSGWVRVGLHACRYMEGRQATLDFQSDGGDKCRSRWSLGEIPTNEINLVPLIDRNR